MVGVFAVSELLVQAGEPDRKEQAASRQMRIVLPSWANFRRLTKPQLIGSGIGAFEGCMPGAGGTIASFMAYNEARRWSKTPERFGKGSDEAIVAPEAANNTVAGTAIIPVLSFGIPGSNSTAILLGGLLIHGLQPGPLLFDQRPDVIYGLFGGLLVANVAQLLIGILLLTPAIWLVNRPKPYLMAAIYALIFSGIYSIDHSLFDLYLVLIAGAVGYVMRLLGFPFLPLVLGLVLGYLIESNYRRSLLLTGGEHRVFIEDPISLGLLITALVFIIGSGIRDYRDIRRQRAAAAKGDEA
jgi:putative tricarboxylic transport membrane protein